MGLRIRSSSVSRLSPYDDSASRISCREHYADFLSGFNEDYILCFGDRGLFDTITVPSEQVLIWSRATSRPIVGI